MNGEIEFRRRELLLAALALLGGCGGVDSGGTGTGTGASSTYAVGPINGFGSIIVNGVRYDDTSASIDDDDGRLRTKDDLRLGMQAEVLASAITTSAGVSRATASSIRVRSEIVGVLETIDTTSARLSVLGQNVDVVATTVFDAALPGGLAALMPGDVIEVCATLDLAAGRYVASRIERRSSASVYKLRGAVAVLAMSAQTITIGRAVIDWSGVPPIDPATALAPGRLVRVTLATTAVAGVWRATALSNDMPRPDDRELAEIEGRITAFTSASSFAVNGIGVDATTAVYPNGSAGLALGASVEVVGSLRGGVLIASRVQVDGNGGGAEPFELDGRIESVDAPAQRFVVRGVTVHWSASTVFDSMGPAVIAVGRSVEVRGNLSADGLLIEATSVHVDS